MNCWQILGLKEGFDRKVIKIAYAKLLKVTKPDDDPEGFKSLHAAYKEALANIAKTNKENLPPQWFITPTKKKEVTIFDDFEEIEDTPVPLYHATKLDRKIEEVVNEVDQQQLQSDWNNLITQVEAIIETKAYKNDISDWEFIVNIPSLIDIEFHSSAGEKIFEMVSEANTISLKNDRMLVKAPVLDYLNNLFHWDSKWREFKENYGSQINAIYPFLFLTRKDTKKIVAKKLGKQSDYYYQRLMTYMLDMSLIFLFIWINFNRTDKIFLFLPIVATIYGLIIMPLMEASRYQASIGKIIFQLKVIDANEEPISKSQSFLRMASTLICIIGFPIAIWINFYLYFVQKENNLLQDIMTKTYVTPK